MRPDPSWRCPRLTSTEKYGGMTACTTIPRKYRSRLLPLANSADLRKLFLYGALGLFTSTKKSPTEPKVTGSSPVGCTKLKAL
jgi:hypothetical protein